MNVYARLLQLLEDLEAGSTYYTLSKHRPDMIMVNVAVPGERWEIEFEIDGEVHLERFVSTGHVGGQEMIVDLYETYINPELVEQGKSPRSANVTLDLNDQPTETSDVPDEKAGE
jgi:hypothetical protein